MGEAGVPSRWPRIGLWVLRAALALLFGSAGLAKLSGQPALVAEFARIGLGQGFRLATGAIEVAAAILLLIPRTSPYGALAMLGVLAGAFVAQIGPLHGDVIHVVVIAGLVLLAIALSRRGSAARPLARDQTGAPTR